MKGVVVDVAFLIVLLTLTILGGGYITWEAIKFTFHPCYRNQYAEFSNFEREVFSVISGSKRANLTILKEISWFKFKHRCDIKPYLNDEKRVFCINITRKFLLSRIGREDLCIKGVRVFNHTNHPIEAGYTYQVLIEVVDSQRILTFEKRW